MEKEKTQGGMQTGFRYKEPALYRVIMHNDDVTTMDFVVMVLATIFHKSELEAEVIMLKIHHEGKAVVGTYYRDIAVTKQMQTMSLARENNFPLVVTVEKDE